MKKFVCSVTAIVIFILLAGCAKTDNKASLSQKQASYIDASSLPVVSPAVSDIPPAVSSKKSIYPPVSIADASSPFNPYEHPQLPPQPYQPVENSGMLMGDWHYYADPNLFTTPNPTFQFRLSQDTAMLSFGTLGTDNGVFCRGDYSFYNGVITANIQFSDEDLSSEPVLVLINALHNPEENDRIVLNITLRQSHPDFEQLFGSILGKDTPFIRYS